MLLALASPAIAQQSAKTATKPYPLKVCIVTDNDLGSMGDEKMFIHEGQEIKICCSPCEKRFKKNPAKYLTNLNVQPKS